MHTRIHTSITPQKPWHTRTCTFTDGTAGSLDGLYSGIPMYSHVIRFMHVSSIFHAWLDRCKHSRSLLGYTEVFTCIHIWNSSFMFLIYFTHDFDRCKHSHSPLGYTEVFTCIHIWYDSFMFLVQFMHDRCKHSHSALGYIQVFTWIHIWNDTFIFLI